MRRRLALLVLPFRLSSGVLLPLLLLPLLRLPLLRPSGLVGLLPLLLLPLLRPSGLVGLLPLLHPVLLSRSAWCRVLLVRPLLLRLRLRVLPLLSPALLRLSPRPCKSGRREQNTERDRIDDSDWFHGSYLDSSWTRTFRIRGLLAAADPCPTMAFSSPPASVMSPER